MHRIQGLLSGSSNNMVQRRKSILHVAQAEIEKIRLEFIAAKERFLKIPQALGQMPKMNPEGEYVNRNLRLDNIQVYGFDYDYTLAHYSANLQSLIYDLAKEHLVTEVCF